MQEIRISWLVHLELFLNELLGRKPVTEQLELPLWRRFGEPHEPRTISLKPRDPPGGGGLPIPREPEPIIPPVPPRIDEIAA
jgi:hypothetical protein